MLTSAIKQAGLKETPSRKVLFKIFTNSKFPISAEDIFLRLKKSKVSLTTIYRNLESFEIAGIIKRVDLRKESVFYELSLLKHHHHLVCNTCGDVEDFKVCDDREIVRLALKSSKKFNKINDHSLELFGICNLCSKKQ